MKKRRKDPKYKENEKLTKNKKYHQKYMVRYRANMSAEKRATKIAKQVLNNKQRREEKRHFEPAKLALMDSCIDVLRSMFKGGKTGKARDFVTKERIDAFEKKMQKDGWLWSQRGNKPGMFNIDHICPISFLINNGVNDIDIINHPDNLQPLEFIKNISKQNRMTPEGVVFVKKHVPHLLEIAQKLISNNC